MGLVLFLQRVCNIVPYIRYSGIVIIKQTVLFHECCVNLELMLAFCFNPQSSLVGQTTLGEAAAIEMSKTPHVPMSTVP